MFGAFFFFFLSSDGCQVNVKPCVFVAGVENYCMLS